MSSARKADPYRKLVRMMIALLVLFVLALTAYLLVDSYRRGQLEEQQRSVIEQNNAMVAEYNRLVLAQQSGRAEGPVAPAWPQAKTEGVDVLSLKGIPVSGTQSAGVSRLDALTGGLLVVNRWHPLPADFSIAEGELKSIMDQTARRVPVDARVISLFPNAIAALDEMLAAAADENLAYYLVRGGYRSMQTQQELWDAEVARYADRMTGDTLTEQVRRAVSFPGTSDYQAGMSVAMDAYSSNDPVLNAMRFHETDQSKWLYENAWRYGYVLRFPVAGYPDPATIDKSYKTGINLQMDTYRYVGVPHAMVMHQHNLTMEEYVEFMIEQEHIAVYENGALLYEIFRVPDAAGDAQFTLPAGATDYTASSDNLGGIIVAAAH